MTAHRESVLGYLERTATRLPDKTAFYDESESVTFSRLRERALALGSFIRRNAPGDAPVVVVTDKRVRDIVCFFGILYGGGAYCPVDASLPDARIRSIINTLKPKMIIAGADERERMASVAENSGENVQVVVYGDRLFEDPPELFTGVRRVPTDPAYIIFTSGSTGSPKGVCVPDSAIMNFIESFVSAFGIDETDIIGSQAPFDFDVSVKDIYSAVKTGATVSIIPRAAFTFPQRLIDHLDSNRVTTLIWAVSVISMVANAKGFLNGAPDSLKTVMFSGEVLPVKHLNYWRNALPGVRFLNLYGPTEITCNCLYYELDRDFDETETLPLGIPFGHNGVLVLNDENKPVSAGETGEICVRGPSLALGYYNAPEQTDSAFVQNPLNDRFPERVYRTGDLAALTERGELVFASRKDFQIKHMGHRIELNEVEIAVNSLEKIAAAACLYNEKKGKIALIYQGAEATAKYIAEGLKPLLPKYMFPQIMIPVEKMPYTKNLKIDRERLKREYIGE